MMMILTTKSRLKPHIVLPFSIFFPHDILQCEAERDRQPMELSTTKESGHHLATWA